MLIRFFGCFLGKKKKEGEAGEGFLCAFKTERKERREREREGRVRKQTFPHYLSKSNPAFTSWLDCVCVPNHISTLIRGNTPTQSRVTVCDASLPFPMNIIHCHYNFRSVGSSQHRQHGLCFLTLCISIHKPALFPQRPRFYVRSD